MGSNDRDAKSAGRDFLHGGKHPRADGCGVQCIDNQDPKVDLGNPDRNYLHYSALQVEPVGHALSFPESAWSEPIFITIGTT